MKSSQYTFFEKTALLILTFFFLFSASAHSKEAVEPGPEYADLYFTTVDYVSGNLLSDIDHGEIATITYCGSSPTTIQQRFFLAEFVDSTWSGQWTDPNGIVLLGSSGPIDPSTSPEGPYVYTFTDGNGLLNSAIVNVFFTMGEFISYSRTIQICPSSTVAFNPLDSLDPNLSSTIGVAWVYTNPQGDFLNFWPQTEPLINPSNFNPDAPGSEMVDGYLVFYQGVPPCPPKIDTLYIETVGLIEQVDTVQLSLCSGEESISLDSLVSAGVDNELVWTNSEGDTLLSLLSVLDILEMDDLMEFNYDIIGGSECIISSKLVLSIDIEVGIPECIGTFDVCNFNSEVDLFELLACTSDLQGQWFGPDSELHPATFDPDASALGIYQYVVDNACGEWVAEIEIVDNSASIISSQPVDQTVELNNSALFSIETSSDDVTFQWQADFGIGFTDLTNAGQHSGVLSSNLTVANVSPSNNAELYRCVVSFEQCSIVSSAAILSVDSALSVANVDGGHFSLFPNPVGDHFTFEVGDEYIGAHFQILGPSGKILYSDAVRDRLTTVQAEMLSEGLYFLIIDGPIKQVKKLVKGR